MNTYKKIILITCVVLGNMHAVESPQEKPKNRLEELQKQLAQLQENPAKVQPKKESAPPVKEEKVQPKKEPVPPTKDEKPKQSLDELKAQLAQLQQKLPTVQASKKTESKKITVGVGLDLKGPYKGFGETVQKVMRALFQDRKEFELVEIIHDSVKGSALQQITKLVASGKVDIFLCFLGIPELESVIDLVEQKKIAMLFPLASPTKFHDEKYKNMIHLTGSPYDEAQVLTEYALETLLIKNLVIFYEESLYGNDALKGVLDTLKNKNIPTERLLKTSYPENSLTINDAVTAIKNFSFDGILFFSTSQAASALMQQLGMDTFARASILGHGGLEADFKPFLEERGKKLIFSRTVPGPAKDDYFIIRDYREFVKRAGLTKIFDLIGLTVYIATQLFFEAVDNIKGPVTKEAIIQELESWKDHALKRCETGEKCLKYTFHPKTRTFFQNVWVDTGEGVILVNPTPVTTTTSVDGAKKKSEETQKPA